MDYKICHIHNDIISKKYEHLADKYANFQASVTLFAHVNAALGFSQLKDGETYVFNSRSLIVIKISIADNPSLSKNESKTPSIQSFVK